MPELTAKLPWARVNRLALKRYGERAFVYGRYDPKATTSPSKLAENAAKSKGSRWYLHQWLRGADTNEKFYLVLFKGRKRLN